MIPHRGHGEDKIFDLSSVFIAGTILWPDDEQLAITADLGPTQLTISQVNLQSHPAAGRLEIGHMG